MNPDLAPKGIDYLAHLARESARFEEVLRQTSSGTRVPTCPDWDADDLLWHLAEVQWFWGTIAGRGLTAYEDVENLDRGVRPGDRDGLLAFFGQASGDLHRNLSAATPDTSAWTWSSEQTIGFIRRRQAHEALIHRVDAELAVGDRTPLDPELSTDGVDEALRIMYGGVPPWGQFTPEPDQTVRVRATDSDRSWLLTLGQFTGSEPDGTEHDEPDLRVASSERASSDSASSTSATTDSATPANATTANATTEPELDESGRPEHETAAATVSGAGADLDCWLWHRPPIGQVERSGDPSVLERLDRTIDAGIN